MAIIQVKKKLFSKMKSLALAVQQAQPGDTIELSEGTFKEQLVIDKPLTIIGVRGKTKIEGCLKIEADVTIDGIVVLNYFDEDGNYGIHVHNGTTTISHSCLLRIKGCGVAVDNGAQLIADNLFCSLVNVPITLQNGARLSLTDSILKDNRSNGIIAHSGSYAELVRCTLEQHHYPALFVGGGSEVTVKDSTFQNNLDFGTDVEQSKASFYGCTFLNNRKTNVHAKGGAELLLVDCDIQYSGEESYGVFCDESEVTIERCRIHEHEGPQVCATGATVTIRDTDIYDGPLANGMRIKHESVLHIERCNLYNHGFVHMLVESGSRIHVAHTNIYGSDSVGIELDESTGRIEHCQIYDNRAQINVIRNSEAVIVDCSLSQSREGGYGCYVSDESKAELENCRIYDHQEFHVLVEQSRAAIAHSQLYSSRGNGIRLTNEAVASIEHCEIYDNETIQLSVEPTTNVTLQHCTIYNGPNNGVEIEGATAHIAHCDIFDNGLAQIHVSVDASVTVEHSRIHDGKAETYGLYVVTGSEVTMKACDVHHHPNVQIYIDESKLTIEDTTVHDGDDSGIRFADKATGLVERCDFYAHNDRAQISSIMNSHTVITNSKIHDNDGYGILFDESKGAIEHCELYGNTGRQIALYDGSDIYIMNTHVSAPQPESNGIVVTTGSNAEIVDCTLQHHEFPQLFIDEQSSFRVAKTKIIDGNNCTGVRIIEATGVIEDCEFGGNGEYPQLTVEDDAHVTILRTSIHSGEAIGMSIDNAYVAMEHCQLYGSGVSQLDVIEGATADIRHCQLYGGETHGIRIADGSTPNFSNVDVFGHTSRYAQVVIKTDANPTFKHCKIYGGAGDGILVYNEGRGLVEDCFIYDHEDSNVVVAEHSTPVLRRNTMKQAKFGVFAEEASPTIEECTLSEHSFEDLYFDEHCVPILVGNVYASMRQGVASGTPVIDYEAILGFDPKALDDEALQARLQLENRKWLNRLNAPSEEKRQKAEQAIEAIAALRNEN